MSPMTWPWRWPMVFKISVEIPSIASPKSSIIPRRSLTIKRLPLSSGQRELNPDGQTFTLNFNEPLDSQTIDTTHPSPTTSTCLLMAKTSARPLITPPPRSPQDGTSLTLKLDGRTIEGTQQVLISYDPQGDVPGSTTSTLLIQQPRGLHLLGDERRSGFHSSSPDGCNQCRSQWPVDQYSLL